MLQLTHNFPGLGVQEISMQDLAIANCVPQRDNRSRSTNKPNPIIYRLTCRMAKEHVMVMKNIVLENWNF